MQKQPRHLLHELKRLIHLLRIETLRLKAAARSTRTITTDRPQPNDEVLAEFGQGEWKRFHVHRPEEDN